jgi:hypothetical protein
MNLLLTDAEVRVLRHALDTYLIEVTNEAARSEPHELAQAMWHDRDVLERIRNRLLEPHAYEADVPHG